MTGRADYLKLGDWNALCYSCGFKFKASQMKKFWQGYYLCQTCWNPRQPQDFVRNVPDVQTPPWVQLRPDPIFVEQYVCTIQGSSAYPGYAVAGCMISGYAPTL